MILIDTSAWVEFLRDTGSDVCERVDSALAGPVAVNDAVRMELLAGARNERELAQLEGLLIRCSIRPLRSTSYDEAAQLIRTCRAAGETVRKMIDCLIATSAISADLPLLHRDSDFDVLARHTALRVVSPGQV